MAMVVVDSEGMLLFATRKARLLFRDEALVGKCVEDLIVPELRQKHHEHREGFATRPRYREMGRGREMEAQRADGSRFPVEIGLNPVERNGTAVVLCSIADITERLAVVEEREAMLKQGLQQERLHSLGLLAGGIAHDFNNLLLGIMGNVQIALEMAEAESLAAECLQDAKDASQQAADLASQLTEFAGRGDLRLREMDLSTATNQMAGMLRELVPEHVTVHLDLAAGLPPVHADQIKVRQVVMNLISNAVQAVGEQPGHVWISCGQRDVVPREPAVQGTELEPGRYAFVEVRDSGCGMPAETIERMFEPFFTTKSNGHGLGLAATMGIVRSHGGGLRVKSTEGLGTTITLLLPFADQPLG